VEWISIKERLPDIGSCCGEEFYIVIDGYSITIATICIDHKSEITHWMEVNSIPLPDGLKDKDPHCCTCLQLIRDKKEKEEEDIERAKKYVQYLAEMESELPT